ncbi:MAG TPA: deaminase [Geobacteraceae bacterium]|nr:deaminase [Geobacteraceae bacterium]
MRKAKTLRRSRLKRSSGIFLLLAALLVTSGCAHETQLRHSPPTASDLASIERRINTYSPDSRYPDDPFVLATIWEALRGARERNGGIGACLVEKATGRIVELGHNSQYEPYFRSDLHAEMDLLTRYEERMRIARSRNPDDPTYRDPRRMQGLVLYSSLEPCPMCLTRIINAGVKEVYYAAPDRTGGMVSRFDGLPPFWRAMARDMVIAPARCSPELAAIAAKLFRPMVP